MSPQSKRTCFVTLPSHLILILVAIFALFSLSACGEEPNKKPTVIINNSQGDTGNQDTDYDDVGPTDTGKQDVDEIDDTQDNDTDDQDTNPDPDANPDDDTNQPPDDSCGDFCIASEICIAGKCIEDTADRKCRDAKDLGQLKIGIKKTAEGTLRRESNVITTACGPGAHPADPGVGAEAVFKFTVEQETRIDFTARWLGQYDALVTFHTDSCQDSGNPDGLEHCFDHEEQSFYAFPGRTYFMIVEQNHSRGDKFTVELVPNAVECIPELHVNTCTDEKYERCVGIGELSENDCAADCNSSGTQCLGTSCNDAIVVTASTTFTGDNASYKNQYDFQDIEGCEADGQPIPTPGPEIIFSLPGLQAGQVVSVDTETNDLNSNAIFITSSCGTHEEIQCVATAYLDQTLTWTVPNDGNYFIFIEKESIFGDLFQYSIDIQ